MNGLCSRTRQAAKDFVDAVRSEDKLQPLVSTVSKLLQDVQGLQCNKENSSLNAKDLQALGSSFLLLAKHALAGLQEADISERHLTALVSVTKDSLDAQNLLQLQQSGNGMEVEVQRYSFVRRLVAIRHHQEALLQGELVLSALCRQSKVPGRKQAQKHKAKLQKPEQEPPKDLILLVVGTVLNLLVSTVEHFTKQALLDELTGLLENLATVAHWLR